ncbi:hypothetical protein [Stenotrophomonas phage BUCTxx100]|nr:hypothetical protein [Stenotrophomonas phage BUCTxx100]
MIFEGGRRKTPVFLFTVTPPIRPEENQEIVGLRVYEEATNNVCHSFT